MGENTITNIMKVSVAGTSLKESEKIFTNHCTGKTRVRKLEKAKIVSSEHIANVTGHSYHDFSSRPNEIMKPQR